MRVLRVLAVLGMAVGPVEAATDQPLPPPAQEALLAASTPDDVAALVLQYTELAPTLMFEAALLGVASPAQVIERISAAVPEPVRLALVRAGAEAVPAEANLLVAAAYLAWGGEPPALAAAAILGTEDAGTPAELVRNEALEIAAALEQLAPESAAQTLRALADATSDPDDSADLLAAASAAASGEGPLETADIPEPTEPALLLLSPLGPPSAEQNNPSPN